MGPARGADGLHDLPRAAPSALEARDVARAARLLPRAAARLEAAGLAAPAARPASAASPA